MDPSQAERDARVERILEELDEVETQIEELHSTGRVRSALVVLVALLGTFCAILAFFLIPGIWSLSPFVIAALGYAVAGWISLSTKAEKLAELKQERADLITGGPTAR